MKGRYICITRKHRAGIASMATGISILSLILSGCGNTSGNTSGKKSETLDTGSKTATESKETEKPSEPDSKDNKENQDYKDVKFRISWWGDDDRHKITIQLIEEFEKNYPNFKIDTEYTGWGDYWTKLTTQATGNDLPDVIQMSYNYIVAYANSNLLLQLDSYVERKELDLSKVSDVTIATGKVGGNIYSLVTGINAPCIIYNPATVAEAGLTVSQTPSLEEYLTYSKVIFDKTGAISSTVPDEYFLRTQGQSLFALDGKSVGFTAEALKKYFDILDRGEEQGYFPTVDTVLSEDVSASIKNKEIWTVFTYTNYLTKFATESGENLDMMALPTDVSTAPTYLNPNMLWSVAAGSKNPDIAVKFLDFFVNNQTTYDICGTNRGMPISSEIRSYLEPSFDDVNKKIESFLTMLENGNSSPIGPAAPSAAAEVGEVITGLSEKRSYRAIKPEDYLKLAQECIDQCNEILKNAK